MQQDAARQRAKRKQVRVTFPDGKVICYGNVSDTFIEVLREIGPERFPEITLEMCRIPLVAREVNPRYKEWTKPVCDGWYLNTQSSTDQKYLQLSLINKSLNLGLTVEIGDFEKQHNPNKALESRSKTKEKLHVRFPDGDYLAAHNAIDTFLECLRKIGVDEIKRRGIEWRGSALITNYKANNGQVQIDANRWVSVPGSTRDKAKLLKVLAAHMKTDLDITIV